MQLDNNKLNLPEEKEEEFNCPYLKDQYKRQISPGIIEDPCTMCANPKCPRHKEYWC